MDSKKQRFLWLTGLFVSLLMLTSFTRFHNSDTLKATSNSFPNLSANNFNLKIKIKNNFNLLEDIWHLINEL